MRGGPPDRSGPCLLGAGRQRGQAQSAIRPVCGTRSAGAGAGARADVLHEVLQRRQLTRNQHFVDEVDHLIGRRIERRRPPSVAPAVRT